jgi:cytochrome P450
MELPHSNLDPWDREFLENPFPHYEALRSAGPVVKLDRYGIWAVSHHAVAKQVLDDHETFCSSGGAGIANHFKEPPWRPQSLILEADPPLHSRTRGAITRILTSSFLRDLQRDWDERAQDMVDELVRRRTFDAITELAERYPVGVLGDAIGVGPDGRDHLVRYGQMVFAGLGPKNAAFDQAMSHASVVIPFVHQACMRASLTAGSIGARIYGAVDRGELTEVEAGMLVRSFLSAGVDTTINTLGQAIYCLARHPDQWTALRDDPSLARSAFDETLRFDSAALFVFRTTTRDIVLHGAAIPQHEKILIFLGAANRDPMRWEHPDRFDLRRRSSGHLGLGGGIHLCVGQMLGRRMVEAVLTALARRVDAIAIAEPVSWKESNGLRGLASLRLEVVQRA